MPFIISKNNQIGVFSFLNYLLHFRDYILMKEKFFLHEIFLIYLHLLIINFFKSTSTIVLQFLVVT